MSIRGVVWSPQAPGEQEGCLPALVAGARARIFARAGGEGVTSEADAASV